MPDALTADQASHYDLRRLRLTGNALNIVAVSALTCAIAVLVTSQLPSLQRTAVGLLSALGILSLGSVLVRRKDSNVSSMGSNLLGAAYLLAAFVLHASYYISGIDSLASPVFCWLGELALGLAATVHLSDNKRLRYMTLPLVLLLSVDVFGHALTSTDNFEVGTLLVKVSSVASVLGVLWFGALSAINAKQQERSADKTSSLLHRVSNELYFVLAALSALALPKFISSFDYAPLWWSIETPVLLAICWSSRSFFKHALVMGIWVVAAVLLLISKMDVAPYVQLALPAAGMVMALSYRYLRSNWDKWQKLTGYASYLYGSVALAALVPLLKLGAVHALPYFMGEAALVLVLALLILKDRALHLSGIILGGAALLILVSDYKNWNLVELGTVVAGYYAISLLYGRYNNATKEGLPQSEFAVLPGPTVSATEARYLEVATAVAGFALLIAGSYMEFSNPFNTIAWGAEAFILIAYGFLTNKVGHRFTGLIAMAVASAKLTIFDLSGAATLTRTLVSFGAVGVCCVAASIFYLVEYGRKHGQPKDS